MAVCEDVECLINEISISESIIIFATFHNTFHCFVMCLYVHEQLLLAMVGVPAN